MYSHYVNMLILMKTVKDKSHHQLNGVLHFTLTYILNK